MMLEISVIAVGGRVTMFFFFFFICAETERERSEDKGVTRVYGFGA